MPTVVKSYDRRDQRRKVWTQHAKVSQYDVISELGGMSEREMQTDYDSNDQDHTSLRHPG
jgi:hypothetical protein